MTEGEPTPKKGRRHLPVIGAAPKPAPGDENETPPEERPGWQWSVLTGVGMLLGWLLTAAIVNAILAQVWGEPPNVAAVTANVACLVASALGAGALAGKFGLKASRRQILAGAAGTATFGWLLAFSRPDRAGTVVDWVLTWAVMLGLAVGGAALGMRITRPRSAG
ncbi:MAG TPA: hypothetical protein VL400_23145 [Polyangiaceae bacterium]|jgi:hypothetical protein|nr:hypothetical protein [Polyangiaceae bacterium]